MSTTTAFDPLERDTGVDAELDRLSKHVVGTFKRISKPYIADIREKIEQGRTGYDGVSRFVHMRLASRETEFSVLLEMFRDTERICEVNVRRPAAWETTYSAAPSFGCLVAKHRALIVHELIEQVQADGSIKRRHFFHSWQPSGHISLELGPGYDSKELDTKWLDEMFGRSSSATTSSKTLRRH